MRRRSKKDDTHDEIVRALRAVGCSVLELHAVGGGCPDALVGIRGTSLLMEFKRPGWAKVGGKRQAATLEAQARFRETWRGGWVCVVESADEAVRAIERECRYRGVSGH